MAVDPTRKLQEAEGYLELDLPAEALKALHAIEPAHRAGFGWQFYAGLAHQHAAHYAQALEYLEQAQKLKADAVSVYLAMGFCYKRTDKLMLAIQALHQADEVCRKNCDEDHHALVMYNLSCYYSLAHQKEEMLRWLADSLEKDSSYRKLVADETDFDPFRHDEDFQNLINPQDDLT